MTWDYRVLQFADEFSIIEAYYEGDKIVAWSDDNIRPGGADIEDLAFDLGAMLVALERPVLLRCDLPGGDK